MNIHDFQLGDRVEGFYLLQKALPRTTANGKPFLTAVLADRSGSVNMQVWDYPGPVCGTDAGAVVWVRGTVTEYKGTLQVTADQLRRATRDDRYDEGALVPTAPIDAEQTWEEVRALLASITDPDYAGVCRTLLERYGDAFYAIPAAKNVHHGFVHGLLMHTANMLRAADFMAGLYADTVDRSLLLAGTLLHDLAKCEEFVISPLGLVTDYSVKGQLLGHLTMGAQLVAATAAELHVPEEKSALLQHMILSHHGTPEHGAAVTPVCAESELLAELDLIDSRMEIYRKTFEETPVGTSSPFHPALDKRLFHHE